MDRKRLDRIIVTSNEKMLVVLRWYHENEKWLNKQEFHTPMECGVIELREEMIEVMFRNKGDCVELAIYPATKPNIPVSVIFDYSPKTMKTSNYIFAPQLPKAKRDLLREVILMDKTDTKAALKYHALMLFMTYYRDEVTVQQIGERTKKEAKRLQRSAKQTLKQHPLSLIQKSYILETISPEDLPLLENRKIPEHEQEEAATKEVRKYTKPEYEVHVRGYYRTLQSGKRIWVKPFTRYKDKKKQNREYEW